MSAQPNSHSSSDDSVQKNGIGCYRASDVRAARWRVRGWLLGGLLAVTAVLGVAPVAFAQDIIQVTPTGSDGANGSNWTTNATSLQHALSIATSGDEIWVASGVYTPGLTAASTFTMTSGIQLYGGFAATETLRTQRDWIANPTILSGDIGGDDTVVGGVVTSTNDIVGTNSYNVLWLDGVNGDPITTTTRIDGFTITAGAGGDGGGGLYCLGRGSGNACSPSIANVLFSGNSARDGGAMYNDGYGGTSSPSLVNVLFSGNSANYGGAMYSTSKYDGISSPNLVNVLFNGNSAGVNGGAMYNDGYGADSVSSPSLVNVTFSGNSADYYGGAIYNNSIGGVSNPSLVNVTFSGNSASNAGGAIYNYGFGDGGVSSPSLAAVRFRGNSARDGGAMYSFGGYKGVSSPSLVNVIFSSNSASGNGGAMYNDGNFSGDFYDQGGVSSPSLVNVTFSGNSAGSHGGAMYNSGLPWVVSSPSLANVLLWGNSAANGSDQLFNNYAARPVISNTLIPSNTADFDSFLTGTIWGAGNITDTGAYTTADIFVDAANGDLHLAGASPAIDAGDDAAVPAGVTTDLDGNRRIQGAAVDMGAYESTPLAPDVTLVKTVAPATEVVFGGTVTYTLVLVNNGTLSDSSVTLTDTLPAGASFAGWVEQPTGATFNNDALAWSGAVGQAEIVTFTFLATNTAATGATVTNTAWFSGNAQTGSAAAAYTTSSTLYPSGSGNWSEVYPPCSGVCKYVVPTGFTITLDLDISLAGDFEIESGGTFIPNGKTVTLTGDQAQTLTGNPLSFYNLVVNKSAKTDTVTIDGKLKVSKKLTVRSGKLISASDYEDIEIEENGELQLTSDITVSGHFTNSGTFDSNGFGVTFDGATEQRLVLNTFTGFDFLTVYTGTTLVEAVTDDNAVIYDTLTNFGTIRKTQPVSGLEFYYFGLAGSYPDSWGVEIEVTDRSGGDPLTAIQVDRIDANHPNAPGGATTDIYWTITPSGTNYVATVVLPQNALTSPGACRYSGAVWSCDRSSFDSDIDLTVTRTGVTAFSDWAVFETQATTTTLATSASPVEVDTLVTFTATVEPASVPGSVEFFADGASLGSVAVAAGEAQTSTAGLAAGTRVITAIFTPTGLFLPSSGTLAGGQEITCAATRTVTNNADSGAGSLRQAINDVCAGGTVDFSLSYPATITLTSGEIIIDKSLTIDGPGATNVAVSGNDAGRIFYVNGEGTIDGLTLRNGYGPDGGAIIATNWLTLTDSALISNTSTGFGGALFIATDATLTGNHYQGNQATADGGAIYVESAVVTVADSIFDDNHSITEDGGAIANDWVSYLTVTNSTFTGNTALADGKDGGAIYSANDGGNVLIVEGSTFSGNRAFEGGAIRSRDYLYLSNSTFFNNEATNAAGGGGALRLMDTAYITNTTIYSNGAPGNGGGVRISSSTGSYFFANVIVAGNSGADCSTAGGAFDGGTNLATDATCGANFAQTGDALLGDLGDYGGDTQTLPLLPGSPAIDAGNTTACLPVDQRGVARPAGSACDVGAFESRGFAMALAGGNSQGTSIGYTFATPLAVTVSSSFTEPVDGGRVIFTAPASGASALPTVYTGTVSSGAVTQTMTANMTIGGPYTVTAAARGATPAINFSLTNQCANPATVTNTDDSGLGSLRWAVAAACDYGTVNFNLAYPATIVLTSTQIVVDKNLTIDGPGASDVTVSGGNAMRVFKTASGKAVIIDGLTLRDGYTKESDGGGAIYAAGPLTITSSILISNTADNTGSNDGQGGAISFYGGDYYGLVVQDTSILSNTAYQSGGAIIVRYGTLDLLRTTLAGNTAAGYAEQGGAIYLDEGSGTVTTSVLRDNSVLPSGRGGALYVNGFDTLTISDTQIISNSAEKGGGIYVFESADLAINGGRIGGNTATASGGGLYFHNDDDECGVTLAMSGARVDLNRAVDGGALYSSDAEENYACGDIEESVFVANRASSVGGALYLADDEIDIESSTFNGNTAEFEAGAIYVGYGGTYSDLTLFDNHSGGEGGAIVNAGELEISGATIYSNTAGLVESTIDAQKVGGSGGAIANVGDLVIYDSAIYSNTAGSSGGAIYNTLDADRLMIVGSTLYANGAGCSGGAVSSASIALVFGSAFHGNQASLGCTGDSLGGAIQSEGELAIYFSSLHENDAYAGGAIGIRGSASVSTTTAILATAIFSNTADLAGAIGIGGPSYTRIESASIYSNTAMGVGGIGSAYGGATLELVNTTLTGNSAATLASSLFVAGGNALENTAGFGPDSLTLHNVTIAGNDRSGINSHEADNFSAFVNADINGAAATLAITNTVIAGGANERSCYTGALVPFVAPTTVNNLDNDGTCGSSFRQSDTILFGSPLGYSFDVGRMSIEVNSPILTPTLLVLPLLPGSAAIDTGATSMVATPAPDPGECPETDQRGVMRPVGSACDIGAFESQGFTLTKTGGDNQSTVWGTAFAQPLAISVSSSYSEPIDGGIVTFAGPSSGASTAPVTQTATIAGGAASVNVSANDAAGAYSVTVSSAGAESVAFSLTNAKYATTTSVQSSRNPSPYSVPVTLTATVAVSGVQALGDIGMPAGEVRFSDETGVLATVTLDDGTASLVKSDWAVGTHTVTVEYLGDLNYAGSTAQPFTQVTAPPMTARNDAAGTLQGDAVVINPLANDIDPAGGGLIVASFEQPAHGTVVVDAGAKTVTYTPDPAFSGVDTFTYVARDVNGTTDDALVAVVVTALDETGNAPQISVVDNGTGSTATFDSGPFQVEVQVPAAIYTGTLGEKDVFYLAYTKIVTSTGDVTQPPGDFTFAGMVFDLSAYVNGIELGSYDFPSPLAIVVNYDPALLGNLSPYLLTPFYWNGAAWVHDGISITYIDPANHEISILVWHLTEFGLFAKPPLNTPNYIYLPTVALDSDLQSAAMPAPAAEPTLQEPAAVDEIPSPTPEPAPIEETPTEQPPATEAAPPAEEPAGEPVESTPEALPTEQAPVDEAVPPAEEPAGEPLESTPEALPTEQAPVQQTSAEEPAAPTPTPEAEQPVRSDAAPADGSTETAEPAPDESSVELPLQLHLPLIAR